MKNTTVNKGQRPREVVSYTMSRIKSSGTEIERLMASALCKVGLRGYRKNKKNILGTPDFSWSKHKLAVFCDSSFWHGYKNMSTKIHSFKRRKHYWVNKIKKNIERDKQVNMSLKREGWKIIRFWDFEMIKNSKNCAIKVENMYNKITKARLI